MYLRNYSRLQELAPFQCFSYILLGVKFYNSIRERLAELPVTVGDYYNGR